jgi:HK97 family phage prohead protease
VKRAVFQARMALAEDDDRAITVTCSTETLGRDKIVLVSRGIDLTHYRANPIWLWQHNPDWPVARSAEIGVKGTALVARVSFPAAGVSERADEVLGLIRAGVVNAASTGFEKMRMEPVDPNNPIAGTRIVSCELAEMSFVSIPAVPDALVTERAKQEGNMGRTGRRLLAERFRSELAAGGSAMKPVRRAPRHSLVYHLARISHTG